MSSAFTKRPIHHALNSKDSGAGKSYLLELVSSYFPDRYVIPLGRMSDKALFHRKGILIIRNNETGQEQLATPILNSLSSEIDDLKEKINGERDKESKFRNKELIKQYQKRIREIESQIEEIKSNAEKVIDLNNQIILCLDTPQESLYDAIMSIISQDTPKDQQFPFLGTRSIAIDAVAWGIIGGLLRGLWWLWKNINKRQFRKTWIMWFISTPFLGGILGGITYLLIFAGLIAISQDKTGPNSVFVMSIAALAGFNWEWIVEQFNRVKEKL